MDDLNVAELHEGLLRSGVVFDRGLSDLEIKDIECRRGFRFPPDLRAFLQHAMPVSRGFPNWRDGSEAELQHLLDWPLEGILFDVENNDFWLPLWGERPEKLALAVSLAGVQVLTAPRLIPVHSRRYIPSEPLAAGNPVFSVYQTDVLRYRFTLGSYLADEFGLPRSQCCVPRPRRIRFWDELMALNKQAQQSSIRSA